MRLRSGAPGPLIETLGRSGGRQPRALNCEEMQRLKRELRSVYSLMVTLGIDPGKTVLFFRGLPMYLHDFQVLRRQRASTARVFPFGRPYPCLGDRFSESGSARGHYFHQDLLVARRIFSANPTTHVDAGSRLDGFVAHVASFRPIYVLDARPLSSAIPNVIFRQADLMTPVGDDLVDFCDSLSCLHALEHFGLGRYGDPVSYDGYLLGLDNLHRMLRKGGRLYFSVPIGPERIEFNAHRVFSVTYLLECFGEKYRIDRFSFVDDRGDLHEDTSLTDPSAMRSFDCVYGCGIFELTKL